MEHAATSIDNTACGASDPIVDWLPSEGLTTADVNDSNPNLIRSVIVTPLREQQQSQWLYVDVDLAPGYWEAKSVLKVLLYTLVAIKLTLTSPEIPLQISVTSLVFFACCLDA